MFSCRRVSSESSQDSIWDVFLYGVMLSVLLTSAYIRMVRGVN